MIAILLALGGCSHHGISRREWATQLLAKNPSEAVLQYVANPPRMFTYDKKTFPVDWYTISDPKAVAELVNIFGNGKDTSDADTSSSQTNLLLVRFPGEKVFRPVCSFGDPTTDLGKESTLELDKFLDHLPDSALEVTEYKTGAWWHAQSP
jgi:hypothetical protein